MLQSLRCVRLVLWDEGGRRLISFSELRRKSNFPAAKSREAHPAIVGLDLLKRSV
jgi:hypothetical protein